MSDTVENRTGRSGVSRYRRSSQSRLVIVLASLPLRGALLEKCAQPLDAIVAREGRSEGLDLEPQPRRERGLRRRPRGPLGLAERQRRPAGQLARERRRLGGDLLARNHAIDDSELARVGGAHHAAQVYQLARTCQADTPHEPLRAAQSRDDAEG